MVPQQQVLITTMVYSLAEVQAHLCSVCTKMGSSPAVQLLIWPTDQVSVSWLYFSMGPAIVLHHIKKNNNNNKAPISLRDLQNSQLLKSHYNDYLKSKVSKTFLHLLICLFVSFFLSKTVAVRAMKMIVFCRVFCFFKEEIAKQIKSISEMITKRISENTFTF